MAGRFRGPLIVTSLVLVGGAALVLSCAGLVERPPISPTRTSSWPGPRKLSIAGITPPPRSWHVTRWTRARRSAAGAWIVAGEATVQQGRYQEAVKCFLGVIEPGGKPDEMAIGHALAGDLLARQLHRLSEAEDHYRKAMELDPRTTTLDGD